MISESIDQLIPHTTKRIISQADVVFVMTQIRKIIEEYKKENPSSTQFNVLYFYCHWCLHTDIDRQASATKILMELDVAATDFVTSGYEYTARVNLFNLLNEFVSFNELRNELSKFFQYYKIPAKILSQGKWRHFAKYYTDSVLEAPLSTKEILNTVDRFSFERYGEIEKQNVEPYGEFSINSINVKGAPINCWLTFKDGDVFSFDLRIKDYLKKN